jgi:hypothetical protein
MCRKSVPHHNFKEQLLINQTVPNLKNWKNLINGTQQSFGVTTTGEFSLGFNDCKSCSFSVTSACVIDPIMNEFSRWSDVTLDC